MRTTPDTTTWTAAEDAQLRQLWAEGLTATAMGERMGKNKNMILGRVHRLKLPSRRPGGKSSANLARRAAIAKAYRTGERIIDIAARFKTSTGYISEVARNAGIPMRLRARPKPKPIAVKPAPNPALVRPAIPLRPATTPEAAHRSAIMRDWHERLMAAERVMRGM